MLNDVLTYVWNGMLTLLRYEVLNATGISTLRTAYTNDKPLFLNMKRQRFLFQGIDREIDRVDLKNYPLPTSISLPIQIHSTHYDRLNSISLALKSASLTFMTAVSLYNMLYIYCYAAIGSRILCSA
jgi:hypothetical protein